MVEKNQKAKPLLVLLIIDGWGVGQESIGNIFSSAKISNYQELTLKYPAAALSVSRNNKKNVSKSDNYFTIGTGSFLQKKNLSLIEKLEEEKIKTLILSDQEKYPEMNFFFTGRKKIFNNKSLVVRKDKNNKTTSLLTEALIKAIKKGEYGFIAAAFSDLELISSTGDASAIGAVATEIDENFKKIIKTILNSNGIAIITASAGKAEAFMNPQTEMINKKNTANPVPFILIGKNYEGQTLDFPEAPEGNLSLTKPTGDISNIAPTILDILGLPISDEEKKKSFI